MKKSIIINALLLFIGFFSLNAQTVFDQGSVKLELTDISSDNPEVAAGLEMMKGMSMNTYFNKTHSLTKVNMMGGMMETKTLVNNKTNKIVMLMDMMGQKIKVNSDKKDLENDPNLKGDMEKVDIEHFKSDVKTISGYVCHKIKINMADQKEMTMTAYITEDILAPANSLQGFENFSINGFPLEFTISIAGMMNMTYTAVEINKTLEDGIFELNYDGYEEMTMDEFQKNMGGMTGGGFGF